MLTTTNYKLKKPELSDSPPDITATNTNWDTVDINLKDAQNKATDWDTFKKVGGEIVGPVKGVTGTNGHRFFEHTGVFNSRNALLRMNTANMSGYPALINLIEDLDNPNNNNGFLFALGNGKNGDAYKDSFLRPVYSAYGAGSVNLGSPSIPWDDIYLKGSSKATNGYTKLPNGFILQWGVNAGLQTGWGTSFPIAFPTACVTIIPVCTSSNIAIKITSKSATNFVIDVGTTTGVGLNYLAIGY